MCGIEGFFFHKMKLFLLMMQIDSATGSLTYHLIGHSFKLNNEKVTYTR